MNMTMPDETPKIPDIPGSDQCEDHPLHREAKRKTMDERAKHRPQPLHYRNKVVKCPECGKWFDPNIKITEDTT